MARRPSPWRRASLGGVWYAQVGGRQTQLAPAEASKAEAEAALVRLLAEHQRARERGREPSKLKVSEVVDLFLANLAKRAERADLEATTLNVYRFILGSAAKRLGTTRVRNLAEHDVDAWLDSEPGWGPTTRAQAVSALKTAHRWAARVGHIVDNPIALMPIPRRKARETALTPEVADRMRALIHDQAMRDVWDALRETGCRPGEVMRLTARDVDLVAGTWRVLNKTRRATGEKYRTVYLSDAALALSRRLVEAHPDGPIFRNRAGRAWTVKNVGKRYTNLCRWSGVQHDVPYALRHLYVTDALVRGLPPATVAELVGHVDATMVLRVYSKLRHRTDHLRQAARAVRGETGLTD